MLAGKLNTLIEVQEPILLENELGEVMDNKYKKKFQTKSQVIYKNGSTNIENNEIFTSYNIQFIIRYYHNIKITDRIIYDNNPYTIDSIEKDKQYQLQRINAKIQNE